MKHLLNSFLVLGGLVLSFQSVAENNTDEAKAGMTMTQVSQTLGEPDTKQAPVGTPPITRWTYSTQTVYFEQNRVIHSVVHSQ